jgi:hypothetical protein
VRYGEVKFNHQRLGDFLIQPESQRSVLDLIVAEKYFMANGFETSDVQVAGDAFMRREYEDLLKGDYRGAKFAPEVFLSKTPGDFKIFHLPKLKPHFAPLCFNNMSLSHGANLTPRVEL